MTVDDEQQLEPFPPVDVKAPPSRTNKQQLVTMLIEARFALVNAQNRHMQDVLAISRRMIAESRTRQWCSDYDAIIEDLNDELLVKMTDRRVQDRIEQAARLAARQQQEEEQHARWLAQEADRQEQQRLWDEAVEAETRARLEAQGFPPPTVEHVIERQPDCQACSRGNHATEHGTNCTCCGMVRVDGGTWGWPSE